MQNSIIDLLEKGYDIKNIKKEHFKDKIFLEKVLILNPENIKYIKDKEKIDIKIFYNIFKNPLSISIYNNFYLPEKVLNSKVIALKHLENLAAKNFFHGYIAIPSLLKNDILFNKQAVIIHYKYYSFIPKKHRLNKEICIIMVRKRGVFLKKLPKEMREDFDIKLEAFLNNYAIYNSLLGNYKTDDKKILFAVVDKSNSLAKIPSYERSLDLVIYALKKSKENLKYVDKYLRKKILENFK